MSSLLCLSLSSLSLLFLTSKQDNPTLFTGKSGFLCQIAAVFGASMGTALHVLALVYARTPLRSVLPPMSTRSCHVFPFSPLRADFLRFTFFLPSRSKYPSMNSVLCHVRLPFAFAPSVEASIVTHICYTVQYCLVTAALEPIWVQLPSTTV